MEFSSLDSLIEHERKKFDNLNALIDSEATAFKIEDPVQHQKVKSADLTSRLASTTPVQTPELEVNLYGRDELPAPKVVDEPPMYSERHRQPKGIGEEFIKGVKGAATGGIPAMAGSSIQMGAAQIEGITEPKTFFDYVAGALMVSTSPATALALTSNETKSAATNWLRDVGSNLREYGKKKQLQNAPTVTLADAIDNPRKFDKWAAYALGSGGVYMAPSMVGSLIFGPGGALLPSYMLAHGEISDELLENGIEDPSFAAALAVPVAGLDAIGASRVTAPVRKEAIKRLIKTGMTKTPLREVLGGAGDRERNRGAGKS